MGEVQRAAAGTWVRIPDEFLAKQYDATPPMGPYQPSSLVDFLAGREVEVEAIWGSRSGARGRPASRRRGWSASIRGSSRSARGRARPRVPEAAPPARSGRCAAIISLAIMGPARIIVPHADAPCHGPGGRDLRPGRPSRMAARRPAGAAD